MPDILRWRSWPVVDDFPRSVLLVLVVVALSAGVASTSQGLGYGLLAALLLTFGLSRYLFVTRYELDADGVLVRFFGQSQRIPWQDVRRVLVHREGVHLSPFEQPSRLDSFRGAFLRFARNADEVTRFVEQHTSAPGQAG